MSNVCPKCNKVPEVCREDGCCGVEDKVHIYDPRTTSGTACGGVRFNPKMSNLDRSTIAGITCPSCIVSMIEALQFRLNQIKEPF